MIYSFYKDETASSKFVQENYFPAIVVFSEEELNNKFIVFRYSDSDMLELTVDSVTQALKRLSLTLCNHFSFTDTSLTLPESEEGTLHLYGQECIKCSTFETIVYKNGIEIKLSESNAKCYIKTGQLLFAFSEQKEITNILITNLTSEDLIHVKEELTMQ